MSTVFAPLSRVINNPSDARSPNDPRPVAELADTPCPRPAEPPVSNGDPGGTGPGCTAATGGPADREPTTDGAPARRPSHRTHEADHERNGAVNEPAPEVAAA